MLAMHIPDGFIDGPTSLLAGLVAIAGVALCLKKTRATLDDREIPVVGLAAAFVFAAQMLNFPVASGTSGHLIGGVLAAVLVGPCAGALAITVVLAVQAAPVRRRRAVGARAERRQHGARRFVRRLRRLRPCSAGCWATTTPAVTVAAGIAAFLAPLIAAPCSSSSTRSAATMRRRSAPSRGR